MSLIRLVAGLLVLFATYAAVAVPTEVTPTQEAYFSRIEYTWTSDASGDFQFRADENVPGIIFSISTVPDSSNPPTDNYDITIQQQLIDPDGNYVTVGTDYAYGVGLNRDDTNPEVAEVWPSQFGQITGIPLVTIANAGNATSGKCSVIIYRTLGYDPNTPPTGSVPVGGASTQLLQWHSNGTAKWITMSGDATIADGGAVTVSTTAPEELHLGDDKAVYFGDDDDFELNYDLATQLLEWTDGSNVLMTLEDDVTSGVLAVDTINAGILVTTPDFTLNGMEFDYTALADNYIWKYNASSGNFELEADSGGGIDLDLDDDEYILFGDSDELQLGYDGANAWLEINDAGANMLSKFVDDGTTGTLTVDNSIYAGASDSSLGILASYGGATSGGILTLYEAADDDTTVDAWVLNNDNTEDFVVNTSGGVGGARTALTIDGDTLDVTVATDLIVTTDFTLNGMLFDQSALADNYIWVYNASSGNFELEAQSSAGVDLADDEAILFGDADEIQNYYGSTTNRLDWTDGTNVLMYLSDAGTEGDLTVTDDLTVGPAATDNYGIVTAGAADTVRGGLVLGSLAATWGGYIQLHNAADQDSTHDVWRFYAYNGGDLVIAGDTTPVVTIADTTHAMTLVGDINVDGGDIATTSGDLTIAPAGLDTFVTGDLYVSADIKNSSGNIAITPAGDINLTPTGADTNVATRLNLSGLLDVGDGATLVPSSNTITVTDSFHLLDGSAGTPTSDVHTISGGTRAGQIVIFGMASSGGEIRFHDQTTGSGTNIFCTNAAPGYVELSDLGDTMSFVYDGSNWRAFAEEHLND